jgi:sulfate/thiosulfate transport system permease protein
MSSAAQVTAERSRTRLSPRSAARLRRMTLRGAAIVYLGAMVVLPVAAIVTKGFGEGFEGLRTALNIPGGMAAIRLTLITSTLASLIGAVMGTTLAYALVRFEFPGRRTLSAIVDLPLAIPTLVTGVMLVALYGPNSLIGGWLADIGIEVIFTPIAIMLALLVVSLPLVVRSVQPVLQELDPAEEEAAATLGANGWTTFRKVVLPAIRTAIVGGTLLTFARCLGEFGSVVLVAGNVPNKTLTAPVFIFQLAGQFRPVEAAAVATILFALSFVLVLVTGRLLRRKEETT